MAKLTVDGFVVRDDLAYDLEHHMWVEELGSGVVRIGMDALGLETSGTLAQLSFEPAEFDVDRGAAFGSLEAEKFVGPLIAPVSGRILAINEAALEHPGIVQADPYGAGWLIEVRAHRLDEERDRLLQGAEEIHSSFSAKIREYRVEGVLSE